MLCGLRVSGFVSSDDALACPWCRLARCTATCDSLVLSYVGGGGCLQSRLALLVQTPPPARVGHQPALGAHGSPVLALPHIPCISWLGRPPSPEVCVRQPASVDGHATALKPNACSQRAARRTETLVPKRKPRRPCHPPQFSDTSISRASPLPAPHAIRRVLDCSYDTQATNQTSNAVPSGKADTNPPSSIGQPGFGNPKQSDKRQERQQHEAQSREEKEEETLATLGPPRWRGCVRRRAISQATNTDFVSVPCIASAPMPPSPVATPAPTASDTDYHLWDVQNFVAGENYFRPCGLPRSTVRPALVCCLAS
eukprot:GHVT01048441.1.p1 GENE.GHVT01048441.1~~GHVT01048441.1.p1  ORF type:complete len:312 (+),score=33.50 GHVT01048441.1:357-1292(+)